MFDGVKSAAFAELYNDTKSAAMNHQKEEEMNGFVAQEKVNMQIVEYESKHPGLALGLLVGVTGFALTAFTGGLSDELALGWDSAEGAADILKPGGELIGEAGSRESIRELPGGTKAAEDMFGRLTKGMEAVEKTGYPGQTFSNSGGDFVGYRPVSVSGPPTIDVNISGL